MIKAKIGAFPTARILSRFVTVWEKSPGNLMIIMGAISRLIPRLRALKDMEQSIYINSQGNKIGHGLIINRSIRFPFYACQCWKTKKKQGKAGIRM